MRVSSPSYIELSCHLPKFQIPHTLRHTTHNGKPKGSSHSPWLRGITTLFSILLVPPPASLYDRPLLCCCHSFIVSSADSWASSLRFDVMLRRNLIQSRSCRIHRHGSIQSSNMTTRDSGMARDVRSGLTSEAKAGRGSARKYNDSLASMSFTH